MQNRGEQINTPYRIISNNLCRELSYQGGRTHLKCGLLRVTPCQRELHGKREKELYNKENKKNCFIQVI